MVSRCSVWFVSLSVVSGVASAQSFEADVTSLVETSCLQCHGARTQTPLNLERLGFDLTNPETFRAWAHVFERVENGEMPPPAAPRPDAAVVETALGSLQRALVDANLAARAGQRTPLRRLTRLEYAYTIQDLLQLDEALSEDLGRLLPAEPDSGGFDTVAANQGISPLHVRSYLDAADRALDAAIALGPPPPTNRYEIDYAKSQKLFKIPNRNHWAAVWSSNWTTPMRRSPRAPRRICSTAEPRATRCPIRAGIASPLPPIRTRPTRR